jgi:hypothetical protein
MSQKTHQKTQEKTTIAKAADPRSLDSRRDFLKRAALILGAASISPLDQLRIFGVLKSAILPDALASATGAQVDFFLDFAARASFPYCDLFPPPFFTRGDVDPSRGLNWNETRNVDLPNGRRLILTPPVYGLQSAAANIAYFESMTDGHRQHRDNWRVRLAGHQLNGTSLGSEGNAGRVGPSLGALFAARAAGLRPANPPLVGGVLKEAPIASESYADLPQMTVLQPGVAQLKQVFQARPTTTSNNELRRIIDAIREINRYQADQRLKLRVQKVDSARTASEQGLALISTSRAVDIEAEYNSLAASFHVPTDVADFNAARGQSLSDSLGSEAGLGDPLLGDTFLKAFLGFKHNLFASASVHANLGHFHRDVIVSPEGGGGRGPRAAEEYFARRLTSLITAARNTPHPFRPGRTVFDHMLIMLSTDGGRGPSFHNYDGDTLRGDYNWDEHSFRNGVVLIGGSVRGGYLGDVPFARGGDWRRVEGFDPNSGAVSANARVTSESIYRTVGQALRIPQADLQRYMREYFAAPVIPALFQG